jgi:predicted nuclease with RNAse H fold
LDLAAESKGTALAILEWSPSAVNVRELHVGVHDEKIVEAAASVDKLGIDCALGWPQEFVQFVNAHSDLESVPHDVDGGMAWRKRLAYRDTDRSVREQTGRWPLSVSTDRLGLTAMRCAGLLARLAHSGVVVDRAGAGLVVEVYPGASLRLWGFTTSGYRVSPEVRADLLRQLRDSAPWFQPGSFEQQMISSCDAFDAVVAAFAARSAALGRYTKPSQVELEKARIEGWIALPQGPLSALA